MIAALVAVTLVVQAPSAPVIQATPIWRWEADDLPLDVLIDAEMEHWRPEVSKALRWWNLRLGREVFGQPGDLRGGGLVVVVPLIEPDPPAPETRKVGRASKDGRNALVRVRINPAEVRNPVRTFAHELGHVLGLDHSKDESSVMFHVVLIDRNWRLPALDRAAVLGWLP